MELAGKRKYQAEIASKAGEMELYEFASAEHQQYSSRVERLGASLEQVKNQLGELERKYEEMKHKLKDMQIRRLELMGRENVTRANHRMNQVLDSNTDSNQASSRFQEIDNYLDRLEHQVNSSYYRDTIDVKDSPIRKRNEIRRKQVHLITKRWYSKEVQLSCTFLAITLKLIKKPKKGGWAEC